MKKLLFVAAFLMAAVAASAQGFWAGGRVSYFYEKVKEANGGIHSLVLAPEAGYDFNEKWGVAAAIGYSGSFNTDSDVSTHSFFIQPYARYKFVQIGKASFFVDGAVNYSYNASVKNLDRNTSIKTDAHSVDVGVYPGFAYSFCDKAVLAARLGFLGFKHNGLNNTNGFGFDFSSNSVSLSMYFSF